MDEDLKAYLEAMEGRLMTRLTGLQEQMLERFGTVDQQFRAVEHQLTSVYATLKTMNITMELITALLTDFAKRITNLEDKP